MKNYLVSVCLLLLAACRATEIAIPEPVKNIEGTWRITKATRNGTDLTNVVDFSKFRLHFQNNTYTIDNLLPFIVSGKGTWSLDDPQYPFKITFHQEGVDSSVVTKFDYPITDGQRIINLVFSPGCINNTYQYTLEKISK
ncbi:Lipocalin-like domain [Chitinophaga terrae (ex Kim and Jung 2007)]|jgi:hypothetical protein|uniref:Lipocalin-like domain n=1 Tax=Chitinophaga terrae (ex Kim and Jung 2007) TaxID=408074 RepID=A0A1H3ZHJ6_9BACT|nr:DUF5004 domain-containing protein [Chitinophaga terrae (ex Kim and Jung 2007)]MDQ0109757.1 hypothetical protein [Chitinophaga terrae (ex Kim and Jung 2007)]GEP88745.1 hypothetical protein CTE07_03900 [Chitinophaga terrae (ex Kim and Jung 2007)]SEA22881.1 Lipocalin-like domain [Chitinophaga terrae (ex Kim and Jung 2007)]